MAGKARHCALSDGSKSASEFSSGEVFIENRVNLPLFVHSNGNDAAGVKDPETTMAVSELVDSSRPRETNATAKAAERYRPDIDGLRAVAILPVIFFHAGLGIFSGGFIGVDVFFVISGYLITTIIANDQERGSFSILQFYERRVRRIVPALAIVVAFSCAAAFMVMLPDQLVAFAKSVLYLVFFCSNVFFWHEAAIFNLRRKPLRCCTHGRLRLRSNSTPSFRLLCFSSGDTPDRALSFYLLCWRQVRWSSVSGASITIQAQHFISRHLGHGNFWLARFWHLAPFRKLKAGPFEIGYLWEGLG
jgi:hypothetical protein